MIFVSLNSHRIQTYSLVLRTITVHVIKSNFPDANTTQDLQHSPIEFAAIKKLNYISNWIVQWTFSVSFFIDSFENWLCPDQRVNLIGKRFPEVVEMVKHSYGYSQQIAQMNGHSCSLCTI